MTSRVLVVDDDPAVRAAISRALRLDYEVDEASDGSEALARHAASAADAIVLDLLMPEIGGLDVCRSLRRRGDSVPVLVVTARDAVSDRVEGLDAGADDYLVKPFAISELIARTKALLRRPGSALGTLLSAGNISFDTIGRDVRVIDAAIALPRRELAILEHLMRRLGRVVPKTLLEDKLYGIDDELESNAIPVHVHHLRRRLQDAGATVQIHTVRGVGYLLAELKA